VSRAIFSSLNFLAYWSVLFLIQRLELDRRETRQTDRQTDRMRYDILQGMPRNNVIAGQGRF